MEKWQNEIEGIPDEVVSLIPGYLHRRAREVDDLKQYLSVSNYSAMKQIGHKLKGNGNAYGFRVISHLGHQIEIAAVDEDDQKLKGFVDDLEKELARLTS